VKGDIGSRIIYCLGGIVSDTVYCVDEIPARATKVFASESFRTVGGIAGNAARSIRKLGAQARLLGVVGDDEDGRWMLDALVKEGVGINEVKRARGTSTRAAIALARDGERTILAFSGVGLTLSANEVRGVDFGAGDAVLADWRWPEAADCVLREFREAGKPAVLDADVGASTVSGRLVEAASHVIFSREGLEQFTREVDVDVGPALKWAARCTAAVVGVTDGANGCYLLDRSTSEIIRIPAPRVAAVDTVGAGDVFHGAFTLALAAGASDRTASRYAAYAAASKVRGLGLSSLQSHREVVDQMRRDSACV